MKTIINNIDEFFNEYLKTKFSSKDYRFIKGSYCSKDLTNHELQIIKPEHEESFESSYSIAQVPSLYPRVDTTLWYDNLLNKDHQSIIEEEGKDNNFD